MNNKKKTQGPVRFDKFFFTRAESSWDDMPTTVWLELIRNKVELSLDIERLEALCESGEPIKVKFGIDPTGSNIHIGHVVPMMLVNAFIKKGHRVSIVIGDYTAKIGDPSGRNAERQALSMETIRHNMATYRKQIGMFVDLSEAEVRFNSEWLANMGFVELFSALQMITISQATQREDFRKRMESGSGVTLAEICYSVMMGLDSVALECDVEVGGKDQLLNFQQCRTMMAKNGLTPEIALTTPILEGINGGGQKMSKSLGNDIPVMAPVDDKFGKIMSIPDDQIMKYFICFAFMTDDEKAELEEFIINHPMEAKKQLATYVAALQLKDFAAAEAVRTAFERRFSKREINPEDCISCVLQENDTVFSAVSRLKLMSNAELRRLFTSHAVRSVNSEPEIIFGKDDIATPGIIRMGKKRFIHFVKK